MIEKYTKENGVIMKKQFTVLVNKEKVPELVSN